MTRLARLRRLFLTLSATGAFGIFGSTFAQEPLAGGEVISALRLLQDTAPQAAPTQPVQPTTPEPTGRAGSLGDLFGSAGGSAAAVAQLPADRQSAATSPAANVVSGQEAQTRSASDVGDLFSKSQSALGVYTQHRNPITTDTRIRGQHVGQIYTQMDGGYWLPARIDLDTMLSKMDSSVIRDVIVIKGPYASRYGPGFSFFDIETADAPRYENGYEWHGRSSVNYKTNGEQFFARQSLWGGDADWGFRIGYGHRTGNDYRSGNDIQVPASYNSRDFDLALGFDLGCDSRIELKGLRLDQTNVEFPGQFFDIGFLVTDGYALRYIAEDQSYFDRFVIDAWWNYTRAAGNTLQGAKQQLLSTPAFANASSTQFNLASTGTRLAATWGKGKDPQLTLGADVRFVQQQLVENFTVLNVPAFTAALDFYVPIPNSTSTNPGLFWETFLPWSDDLTLKAGGRLDYMRTTSGDFFFVDRLANTVGGVIGFSVSPFDTSLNQDFYLFSLFATADYKLDCHWTASVGAGYAERPPLIPELYAAAPFVAVLQQGLSRIVGDPHLEKERLLQLDLGLRADYECFRAGINGFYAWIHDYITYSPDFINLTSTQTTFVNTDLAVLAGGELYAEMDLTGWLTPFATVSYVEGIDFTRGGRRPGADFRAPIVLNDEEPLPGIPPLEARLGFRLHEATTSPRWGLEFTSRIVDRQRLVATSLAEQPTPGFTLFDVRSYWRATDNLLLTSGIENLGDKQYREHLDSRAGTFLPGGGQLFQPGINYYFGMELKY